MDSENLRKLQALKDQLDAAEGKTTRTRPPDARHGEGDHQRDAKPGRHGKGGQRQRQRQRQPVPQSDPRADGRARSGAVGARGPQRQHADGQADTKKLQEELRREKERAEGARRQAAAARDEASRLRRDLREAQASLERSRDYAAWLKRSNSDLRNNLEDTCEQLRRRNDALEVLWEMQRRGVHQFVHFTSVSNLESILRHGLLTRDSIRERRVDTSINDPSRYDDHRDALCLSVTTPNYRMFWPVRSRSGHPDSGWCVLLLRAWDIVANCDPMFYPTNAANTLCKGMEEPHGRAAFARMFAETWNGHRRADLCIAASMPTDPQAEVQVRQNIPASYITTVAFVDEDERWRHNQMLASHGIATTGTRDQNGRDWYFSPRDDYAHWQSNAQNGQTSTSDMAEAHHSTQTPDQYDDDAIVYSGNRDF